MSKSSLAFKTFYRFALWSATFFAIFGAIAGSLYLILTMLLYPESPVENWLMNFAIFTSMGSATALGIFQYTGLPVAILLGIIKHYTRFGKSPRLPYILVLIAIGIYSGITLISFIASSGNRPGNGDFTLIYFVIAPIVVVIVSLFSAAYRLNQIEPPKSK